MRLVPILLALPSALLSQTVHYEVSVPSPGDHLFHVRADFPARGKDTLLVALPAWSPGAYEIQNYARYVRHFAAHGANGTALFWDRYDKETWRVATGKTERVSVEFDYLADSIDLSLARIKGDFGEALGTNLFLYEPGHLDRPAEVRFTLPSGWQVTTALRTGTNGVYTAADYHELADAMTFVGHYSLDSVLVQGKWIRIALWPADAYTPAVGRHLRESVSRMATVETALMGGPPYDAYTIFFNVIREPISFGGGLEHSASQFDIMPAGDFADAEGNFGDFILPLLSHEFFHLWNVKRIRPAEMWPYDYHAEQYTPLLWWSEGVTDYYADVVNLRAGLWDQARFLHEIEQNLDQVESAPEPWSEEDGSVATWINEIYVNSSQLYYPKGSLTGMLLDIGIRDATDNAHSLDDVTRALYTRFYKQGKGFKTADLLALFKEVGAPDVDTFYQRYINGRDPLPYDSVFAKAGLTLARQNQSVPFVGVGTGTTPNGHVVVQNVVAGSAAAEAGLEIGDELLKVGDITIDQQDWSGAFRAAYHGKAGAPLGIVVRRGDQTLALNTRVQERQIATFTVTPVPNPTPKQAKIWHGIATGTTGA